MMTLGMLPLSDEIGEESITIHGGWSGPDVARTPAVVAAVGLIAGPTENDDTLDCADECEAWDSGYQHQIIDGVTVVVICVIQRSRSGRIRLMSLVENMWINIILTCRREWNRWSLYPVGIRLDPTGGMMWGLAWRMCVRRRHTVHKACWTR